MPYNLEVLDYRDRAFTNEDAIDLLRRIAAGEKDQIQVRCDSQILADAVRAKIFRHAMADGRQFEITILGSGTAVGVKKFMVPAYIWDEKSRQAIPREQWEAEHGS